MKRAPILALLLPVALLQPALARAQDAAPPRTTLAFGPAPDGWKPHPKEAKPFVVDYDVPAAEGDAADATRSNVMLFPMGFEDYRKKITQSWRHQDGSALTIDDQKTEELAEPSDSGLKLRLIEESGTHVPKKGPEQPGWKLVAVHIRGSGGKWTAWLMGPQKSVDAQRDAYLHWVKTAREVPAQPEEESAAVREVRFVHGAPEHGVPGPWALVAYRIGKDALTRFGVKREQSWDLIVTHRSPRKVQYACMLDGLLAATGCSPGKMNLVHEAVEGEDDLATTILHKPSKRTLTYKLTKSFRDKIRSVDEAAYPAMAKIMESMKDDEVFTVEESSEK